MKELIKAFVKNTPLYPPLRNAVQKRRQQKELVAWDRAGRPVPPPHIVKQKTLRKYSKTYGLRILVETGTYLGDMVEAMKADFDRIYSIELSKDLHEKAAKRFEGVHNIELIHGDSGTELGNVERPPRPLKSPKHPHAA